MLTTGERGGAGGSDGQQDDRDGHGQQVAGGRSGRPGQCLGGRLHAAVKPTVVQLGDGAILGPSALQATIFRLVLLHRIRLDVPGIRKEKKFENTPPSPVEANNTDGGMFRFFPIGWLRDGGWW